MNLQFDPKTHIYTLDGKIIPNVTQIISELLPIQYKSDDWYLTRGRAVHQAAAFIARGIDFDYDDRISGQVAAIHKFFDEVRPDVKFVEEMVFSRLYRFAGTLDLAADLRSLRYQFRDALVDYKSSMSIDRTGLQLSAYSLCMVNPVSWGLCVEINENGKYKISEPINLKNYRREFLALRATYAVRERLNLNKKPEI
jgi:hypothetical protein